MIEEALETITVRKMLEEDIGTLSAVFDQKDYYRSRGYFETILDDSRLGKQIVLIAEYEKCLAGYLKLIFSSKYEYFRNNRIPEINDLIVRPGYRKRGVATQLLLEAEKYAKADFGKIGLGVGLYKDYGEAQKLYAKLGYIPDGNGISYENELIAPGTMVRLDDELLLYWVKELR